MSRETADFYCQRQWVGSIYGGRPEEVGGNILKGVDMATEFESRVELFLNANRKRASLPGDGWPWPWVTSAETDWVYQYLDHRVWVHKKGTNFWKSGKMKISCDPDLFPCMADVQNIGTTERSGMILVYGGA